MSANNNPLGAYQELSMETAVQQIFLESLIIELGGLPEARQMVDQAVTRREELTKARESAHVKAFGSPMLTVRGR
jgi:hypothetical protein